MIDTFSCTPLDLYKATFSFKEFLLKFKEADATNDRRSVHYVNV